MNTERDTLLLVIGLLARRLGGRVVIPKAERDSIGDGTNEVLIAPLPDGSLGVAVERKVLVHE